jgi:hypothetical protein
LFNPSLKCHKDEGYVAHFREQFEQRYGRHHYIIPLSLLAVTSGLALLAIAQSIIAVMTRIHQPDQLDPVAVSALLGAYSWVVWDQLARFRSRDFTIHDVYGCTFRFIIAVPLAKALAAALPAQAGPPLAFMLGAFPTQALFQIIRRRAGQQLALDETKDEGPTELVKLQGISRSVAERFQEEGITTIPQLAWTEPVDLAIRTNFDFDFVIDCQSQALLWTYLEAEAPKLPRFMIRGSMEVAEMLGAPWQGGPKIALAPQETLQAAADAIGMDKDVFAQTLLEIARDPYTQILCSIWYPRWLT